MPALFSLLIKLTRLVDDESLLMLLVSLEVEFELMLLLVRESVSLRFFSKSSLLALEESCVVAVVVVDDDDDDMRVLISNLAVTVGAKEETLLSILVAFGLFSKRVTALTPPFIVTHSSFDSIRLGVYFIFI